jgi:CheY-like chemotaxis protein
MVRSLQHRSPMRKRRLVIADDSAEMRWLVKEAVGRDFDEVVEAADGRELFWALLRRDFMSSNAENDQVLVTDLFMPTYDGLDVIAAWRDLQPKAPIVLITAFPSGVVRKRAEELGAVMIAKPFSTTQLRQVIHEVDHGGIN